MRWTGLTLACLILFLVPVGVADAEWVNLSFMILHGLSLLAWLVGYVASSRGGVPYNGYSILVYCVLSYVSLLLLSSWHSYADVLVAGKRSYLFVLLTLAVVIYTSLRTSEIRVLYFLVVISGTLVSIACVTLNLQEGAIFQQASFYGPFGSPLYIFCVPLALVLLNQSSSKAEAGTLLLCLGFILWRSLIGFNSQPLVLFVVSVLLSGLGLWIVGLIRFSGIAKYFGVCVLALVAVWVIADTLVGVNLSSVYYRELLSIRLENALEIRFNQYTTAWEVTSESLIFGNGPGFDFLDVSYIDRAGVNSGYRLKEVDVVHSLYAYILIYFGLCGLVLIGSALIVPIWLVVVWFTYGSRIGVGAYTIGGAVVVVLLLLMGFVSTKSHTIEAWTVVSVVVGCIMRDLHSRAQLL